MRIAIRVGGALAIGVALVGIGWWLRSPTAPAYNVLLISLDTVRRDVLGVYGHRPRLAPDVSTSPVLDRFALEGVRMLDAYGSSSWTLPSHLSMFTGLSPLAHGVETEVGTLDPSVPTMAEILRRQGYRTVGIYSAPYLEPTWGFGRGFDLYQAVDGPAVRAAAQRASAQRVAIEQAATVADWARYDQLKWEQVAIEKELNDRSQTVVTSAEVAKTAVSQLEGLARGQQPWFMFAHFFDAHCDYVPPAPYDRTFDAQYTGSFTGENCLQGIWDGPPDPKRPGFPPGASDRDLEHVIALYEGEVAWVDANVGTILQALDRLDLTGRTLVLVTADHGEEFLEHGGLGHRATLLEEVLQVPMLVRLPNVLPAGAAVRGVVSVADVLPTVLDVLGMPSIATLDGSSFLPLLSQPAALVARGSLARLVTMVGGQAQIDTAHPVPLRQVGIYDVFRQGAIKITRTRSWPQFSTRVPPGLKDPLQAEASVQFAREQLQWIDLDQFPAERDEQHSTVFTKPEVRAALADFRRAYVSASARRRAGARSSPLPENMRLRLESLGYVEAPSGPEYAEPDVVLPPPGEG